MPTIVKCFYIVIPQATKIVNYFVKCLIKITRSSFLISTSGDLVKNIKVYFTFQYPLLSEPIRSIKPLSFNFERILLIVRCEIPSFVIKCLMVKSLFSCNADKTDNSFSENFTLPFTLPFLSLLLSFRLYNVTKKAVWGFFGD